MRSLSGPLLSLTLLLVGCASTPPSAPSIPELPAEPGEQGPVVGKFAVPGRNNLEGSEVVISDKR